MQRRAFLGAAGAGIAAGLAGRAAAQPAIDRGPITVIVPFPPGGGSDTSTRLIMKKLQDNLGQPVVIENRPGGNTIIGTQALVRSAPNGRTLCMVTTNLTANVSLYKGKLPYDSFADIAPVSLTHGNSHVLMVHPALPARTFGEFIALAKAKPGGVSFGSPGAGSTLHLCGELLKTMAGIDLLHVPYKGVGTLLPDLYSGRVDCAFASMPLGMEMLRDKRMRALAVTTTKRQPELPDLPTIAESYPGYEFTTWFGYAVTGATPAPIVSRLSAELNKAVRDPETVARLENFQIFGTTPSEFANYIKADAEKAARIIQVANVKVE